MKRWSTLITLFSCVAMTQLSAKKNNETAPAPVANPNAVPAASAYNAPGRIDPQGSYDVFINGSFIYWQPMEGGLEAGTLIQTAAPREVSHIDISSGFKPGFKVGIGYGTSFDNWVLGAEYTRFNAEETISSSAPSGYILANSWLVQTGVTLSDIAAKWNLDMNLVDVNLGRPFFQGTKVVVHPLFGLRFGWIDQTYRINSTTSTGIQSTAKETSDSWLVGFRGGLASEWLLGAGFSFVGDLNFGLYYQSFSLDYNQGNLTTPSVTYSQSSVSKKQVMFNPDILAGFKYGAYLDNGRYHFDILAAYIFQTFFEQNYMGVSTASTANQESLYLQGLTLTARFDF